MIGWTSNAYSRYHRVLSRTTTGNFVLARCSRVTRLTTYVLADRTHIPEQLGLRPCDKCFNHNGKQPLIIDLPQLVKDIEIRGLHLHYEEQRNFWRTVRTPSPLCLRHGHCYKLRLKNIKPTHARRD